MSNPPTSPQVLPHHLAAETLRRILCSSETYDQATWFSHEPLVPPDRDFVFDPRTSTTEEWETCGSTACVAGHAVAAAAQLAPDQLLTFFKDESNAYDDQPQSLLWCDIYPNDIPTIAMWLLGLDNNDAEWLFSIKRDYDDVIQALDFLANQDPHHLAILIERDPRI